MEITKRDGRSEAFDISKIENAIRKALASTSSSFPETLPQTLAQSVAATLGPDRKWGVEDIQDIVEKTLMASGEFDAARNYILFRNRRAELRNERGRILAHYSDPAIESVLEEIQNDYPESMYSLSILADKYISFSRSGMGEDEEAQALVRAAVELTSAEAPKWQFIAARFLLFSFQSKLSLALRNRGIRSFSEKVKYLTDEGLYGPYILKAYNSAELDEAASFIVNERNKLFTYSGLDLLLRRYVIHSHSHEALETPQEMFLGIALHLAIPEKKDRMKWVRAFYDMLSRMEVTMATPTLANARKPINQLSSCFIDTVPDSLAGIYRSLDNFAKVSKFGGGMGLYFGKVRANGSAIRGFEGAAGGVIRWIRLVNDTAVAVDQLGVRAGAVAVYLDVWHRDLPEFLNLRTNNGDDRMKAHDVFPAVSYPDYFWQLCSESLDSVWYMMCPHEIWTVKGYHLEDYYGEEWTKRYLECVNDSRIHKRSMVIRDLVRLIIKSAVETGTPFVFNRDEVNRMNPNKHKGMIYSSNLCTEIAQNMSEIEEVSIRKDGDVVVTTTKPGDFVVCNLASLSLGNFDVNDSSKLREVIRTVVRALDNVITLNFYPVPYAEITNSHYRSIGLGVSGYHHMLAKNGIKWESEEHLAAVDKLFESINYYAIEASSDLSAEKGSYAYFHGSEWESGKYFERRGYDSGNWLSLKQKVHEKGMRNAYLLAIAPTSSTSIISGTSAGVDPVMKRFFYEEKKGSMLPRTAPELSGKTWWFYKGAHEIDQSWSVRAAGVRQRHIDQAQSVNLYITNDYTMREVLDLLLLAWKNHVKTLYYTRSKSLEVEECESCSS
ncbi:MAG: ribonucleoside-diphosphate reductase subunit alpha [Spirochaetes bacterium]|uniref:Ribonucleoside-diphosphate reductase n=1 Tax=Candidatus Ornithospirochaeta stercoripullorum TaxID=2840899 RepID=A0A9D9H213_9SPIO|nr:ribonucleoside-diphosphate reductase subunit alpha [Candidatus Ornithospirochaeta stercoripullorum]